MKKLTKTTIACISCLIFAFSCLGAATAASPHNWNSVGKITFKETGTVNTAQFDATDLDTIYSEVSDGRALIAASVNTKGYGALTGAQYTGDTPFSTLATAVGDQFTLPEAPAESYYLQEDNTISTAVTEEPFTSFSGPSANSLSAGVLAYDSNGALIVGNGEDNKEAYNSGKEDGYDDGYSKGYAAGALDSTFNMTVDWKLTACYHVCRDVYEQASSSRKTIQNTVTTDGKVSTISVSGAATSNTNHSPARISSNGTYKLVLTGHKEDGSTEEIGTVSNWDTEQTWTGIEAYNSVTYKFTLSGVSATGANGDGSVDTYVSRTVQGTLSFRTEGGTTPEYYLIGSGSATLNSAGETSIRVQGKATGYVWGTYKIHYNEDAESGAFIGDAAFYTRNNSGTNWGSHRCNVEISREYGDDETVLHLKFSNPSSTKTTISYRYLYTP